jgi:cobalt/nickel transport system ATP-binding protein
MNKNIFELSDIHYSYYGKIPALQGVTVDIPAGGIVTIIGANGSGKSTLLQLMDGLIFPDRGTIKAFGRELKEGSFSDEAFAREFRQRVGLVFQDSTVQLFCPTVREDIVFGPLNFGLAPKTIADRLDQLVTTLGIAELLDRQPHQLSIGERKKVAIASTLISEPEVLLLDEPTAGLDPNTTRHIIEILLAAHRQGKTLIISTHDLPLAAELGGTVHVFERAKRIVASGRAEDILQDNDLLLANNLLHYHSHSHNRVLHSHPHNSSHHLPQE